MITGVGVWAYWVCTIGVGLAGGAGATTAINDGPYCGLYCLYYVSVQIADSKADFRALLKPEYVSSYEGSTLGELMRAAGALGMESAPVTNMSIRELGACPYRVVLHVRADAESAAFDHWLVYVGSDGDRANIYDPPAGMKSIPVSELAARWDGSALLLSSTAIGRGWWLWAYVKQWTPIVLLGAVYVLAAKGIGRRGLRWWGHWSPARQMVMSVATGGVIVGVGLGCGTLQHVLRDDGMLAHPAGVAFVQEARIRDIAPRVDAVEVRALLSKGAVYVIDARYPEDYAAEHIPTAVNIPVALSPVARQAAMDTVDRRTRLVVYCQSRGCSYASRVAARLRAEGFENIALFEGGWAEWKALKGEHEACRTGMPCGSIAG